MYTLTVPPADSDSSSAHTRPMKRASIRMWLTATALWCVNGKIAPTSSCEALYCIRSEAQALTGHEEFVLAADVARAKAYAKETQRLLKVFEGEDDDEPPAVWGKVWAISNTIQASLDLAPNSESVWMFASIMCLKLHAICTTVKDCTVGTDFIIRVTKRACQLKPSNIEKIQPYIDKLDDGLLDGVDFTASGEEEGGP